MNKLFYVSTYKHTALVIVDDLGTIIDTAPIWRKIALGKNFYNFIFYLEDKFEVYYEEIFE